MHPNTKILSILRNGSEWFHRLGANTEWLSRQEQLAIISIVTVSCTLPIDTGPVRLTGAQRKGQRCQYVGYSAFNCGAGDDCGGE